MFNDPADSPWRPLWSLAIEEWFYVGFPFVCCAARRNFVAAILAFGLFALGPLLRTTPYELFFLTGCADSLALGCLTAILLSRAPRLGYATRAALTFVGILLIAIVATGPAVSTTNFQYGPTAISVGASLLIASSQRGEHVPLALKAALWPLRRLGQLSYELYLFHMVIFIAITPVLTTLFGARSAAIFPAAIAILFIIAATIERLFSKPTYRLISGLNTNSFPRRQKLLENKNAER